MTSRFSNRVPAAAAGLAVLLGALPALGDPGPGPRHGVHHRAARHHRRAAYGIAPLPGAPRAHPTATVSAAPVPDESVTPPVVDTTPTTTLEPKVFSLHYPPQGDGYPPGSSAQDMADEGAARVNGVQLTVPLAQ
jgi:hypothetical protein